MVLNSTATLRVGCRPDLRSLIQRERIAFAEIRRFEWELEDEGKFSPRWLEETDIYPQVFWRSRSGAAQTLAVGEAVAGSLRDLLPLLGDADEGVRVFGGRRFDAGGKCGDSWRGFPVESFFIPKAEIIHARGRTRLALNLSAGDADLERVADWIGALGEEIAVPRPCVLTRWDEPNFNQWSGAVEAVLGDLAEGRLRKVVLARRSCLELTEEVSPYALAGVLMGAAPACFHFSFQPSATSGAFLGASPELLYRRNRSRLESEAVAGTRPRSLDAVEDERLESQLLKMSKEQLEHGLVVQSLATTFGKLCEDYSQDGRPGVLKLSRVQHLRTAFSGTLRDGVGDAAVLEAFHPTPATCGFPTDEARSFIAAHEPFDRGWYAGPFGCVSRDEAEFAVAIRSMLSRGAGLQVFAGAGIVEGSDPEREWAELEDKISGVLNLLSP